MIADYLRFAVDGIRGRSLRSWLTTLGVVVGMMAVVTLISLGQGLQDFINDQFAIVGKDRVSITPSGGGMMLGPPTSSTYQSSTLTDKDLSVVKRIQGVELAIGGNIFSGNVRFGEKTRSVPLFAAPTDPKSVDHLSKIDYYMVDKGRHVREGDIYKAQVGAATGEYFFDREIRIGDTIIIEGYEFEVVGINKKTGTPFQDYKITIPLKTAQEIFNKPDELSIISAKVAPGYTPSKVADEIKEKLRKSRGVKKGEEDFTVQTAENIIATFNTIVSLVTGFVVSIAAVSLIVGGFGIMTTMYTSILERTKQIGIMKAVGARNFDILAIFVTEAGLIGLMGGIIGTVLGLVISKIIEGVIRAYVLEKFSSYITFELLFGSLMFSFIVGCVSGYLPAKRAAKMNPVDALRYG